MLKMDEFFKVRNLIAQGKTNSEIARELGITRATVRKYRKCNTPPKYKARDYPSRVDPVASFEGQITEWIKGKADIRATALYDVLKEAGYIGSLRAIQRRVAQIKRHQHPAELFFEQEYRLGEQCQFDFKESVTIPFIFGDMVCHLFVGTLPASGAVFIKAYPNKKYVAFADGVFSFFEFIGGITEDMRFDNLAPVVAKVLKGNERIYTKSFERLQQYLGVKPSPCRPAKGSDKGDVEREIRNIGQRISDYIFLKNKKFQSFEDLNIWLIEFSDHFMSPKSRERFSEEKMHLSPCPPREESIICEVSTPLVSKNGTVLIKKSRYSVPNFLIGQTVKAVVSAYDVRIYDLQASARSSTLVATHPLKIDGENSILLEHTITSLVKKPQAMVRWAHRAILFPEPVFQDFYSYLKRTLPHSAESQFLKSLNLIHHVKIEELRIGLELIMEMASKAPFDDLKQLVFQTEHCAGNTPTQPPINNDLSMYDSLIPA
jgi:transposase